MLETKPSGMYYKIENAQALPAFFINVVSASDVWMFLSSNGTPAAGRQNAGMSVFPYETDDRLHLATSTGPKTLVKLADGRIWEPFDTGYDNPYKIIRNIYKRVTGDAVMFEEINESINISFSYRWETSEKFGIVRTAEIVNLGSNDIAVEVLDGIENIMPYGIPPGLAQGSSCLTDAYKACERPNNGRLVIYSLTSTIGDTPEPVEVLCANVAWYIGEAEKYMLSSRQINAFATGKKTEDEVHAVGRKGAIMTVQPMILKPAEEKSWLFVMDAKQTQHQVVALLDKTSTTTIHDLRAEVEADIKKGTEELYRIVAAADGLQKTSAGTADIRHYMNVLYNNMRGGVFLDGYDFDVELYKKFVATHDKELATRCADFFAKLVNINDIQQLHDIAYADGDPDLIRLSMEFLPLTFSRRHGDPSRPWNYFNIRVKDDDGNRLYHYEGNWRDIFQNWEAMSLSFPVYLAPIIAKFLNASTADGYNPYRINNEGIDWETPAPHDPWSGTGYWGDHQIVYLNKLLEWLNAYAPKALSKLTEKEIFTYAEVPYEIVPYESLLKDGKHTIYFNRERHNNILARAETYGTDGKLLMNGDKLYRVSFVEKLLVPVLAKLSNLVIGGGIWMNTQRPEWNDANNAIVGNGLSMVTVYQMYRHLDICANLLKNNGTVITISTEVKAWYEEILAVLRDRTNLTPRAFLDRAGDAFCKYRKNLYAAGLSGNKEIVPATDLIDFYKVAREALAETIDVNKRDDGMYHSYNILNLTPGDLKISPMFLMLEGQTAVLGSGRLSTKEALALAKAMENSDLLNKQLNQFFLYPMKRLNTFIERNIIPHELAAKSQLFTMLLKNKHDGFVLQDIAGNIRFHHTIQQSSDVENRLKLLSTDADYSRLAMMDADLVRDIYEVVFAHKQFTGRSGIMYKYEGIGCIYWHQNSKFMLSLQEVFTKAAIDGEACLQELKDVYYRLQSGFGFHKTPVVWGAFPLEPYSHTPYNMPAQQPGMTGQVKEDILTRMAELGIIVKDGILRFDPALLNHTEFLAEPDTFNYIDVNGKMCELQLPANSLAFTICQVPVVYHLAQSNSIAVYGGSTISKTNTLALDEAQSRRLFVRDGSITKIDVFLKLENGG